MRLTRITLAALILAAASSSAHAQVISRDREMIDEMRRQQAMQQQRDGETRVQRARDKCLANRGTDCDTMEGLQEWMLLDRSRADAVLDRIAPSASTGSSALPGSTVPELTPRNVGAVPR